MESGPTPSAAEAEIADGTGRHAGPRPPLSERPFPPVSGSPLAGAGGWAGRSPAFSQVRRLTDRASQAPAESPPGPATRQSCWGALCESGGRVRVRGTGLGVGGGRLRDTAGRRDAERRGPCQQGTSAQAPQTKGAETEPLRTPPQPRCPREGATSPPEGVHLPHVSRRRGAHGASKTAGRLNAASTDTSGHSHVS